MKKYDIIAVKYGESYLSEKMIFSGGAEDKLRHIDFIVYLIKTDKRLILVDAGCETMPGFEMKKFCGPLKALAKLNINAGDITDVIITHAHHDHIECVAYYKNAVIHIQKDEFEAGRKYIPEEFCVNIFEEEYTVADGVKVIKIGGHSAGSCIVTISDNEREYVVTGDECYLHECIEKQIPTGSSCDPLKSRMFIEKYSDSRYTVLLCHEE